MYIMRFFVIIIISYFLLEAAGMAQGRIKGVHFEGNKILDDDELLDQMNSQPKKSLEKIMFWKKRPDFIMSALEADIDRLRSYYHRNGFLNPEIGFDIDSLRSGKLVDITISITENEFVRNGRITIDLTGDMSAAPIMDSVRTVVPLKPGERFTDENIFLTESMITEAFSDNGYPFISADYNINVNRDSLIADIFFSASTGNKSFFGDVTITGDSLIPERFMKKYQRFSTGELYSQQKVDSTQQDLYGTSLYQYVVISSKKDSVEDNRIPVEIVVKELPRWKLETGIGYGSEDRVRLAAELTRRNFLGGARKLILDAKTSYFLPFSFEVRFVQPDFLMPKLDLIINPFYIRERRPGYRIDRGGGGVNLVYKITRKLDANLSYAFEHDRIIELLDTRLDPSELKHNKSVFSLGSRYNSTNDLFYPSTGYKIEVTTSLAGLGYRNAVHYYKAEATFTKYFSLAEELVLATKIKSGVIETTRGDQRTPVEERFLLGGASSLRGWPRHGISPLSESGVALGGNTMLEGSAELRFPVYEIVHGAVFADAGNAWTNSYQYELGSIHYNAGIGLRVRTPIGPLRLDFATPVINDSFSFQFFISIGHAF
jgi:outer membrane protein assembly complex protein YaeT